jgi:hypothetical protein
VTTNPAKDGPVKVGPVKDGPVKDGQAKEERPYMCLVSDRILMLAFVPKNQLAEILPPQGAKPGLPAHTREWLRQVDGSAFWLVVPFEGRMAKQLQDLDSEQAARKVPELKGAIQSLKRAKAVSFAVDVLERDKGYRLGLGIICGSEADAAQMASSLKEFWNGKTMQAGFAMVEMMIDRLESSVLKDFVNQIKNGMQFNNDGATASVSLDLPQQMIEDLFKEAQKLGGGGGFPRIRRKVR